LVFFGPASSFAHNFTTKKSNHPMKLTPFARILIACLLALGAFFAFQKLAPQFQKGGDKTEVTDHSGHDQGNEDVADVKSPTKNTDEADEPVVSNRNKFSYLPAAPVNGKLKGIVVVGAAGFDSFIIEVDDEGNWKLEKAEFGSSLVYENMASDEDIRGGLRNYIGKMLNYGVNGRDIHFVVSSGAIKEPNMQKIATGLKSLKYVVNPVTAEQEAEYGFKVAVPKMYSGEAFMMDIGSGNTKVAWMQNGQLKTGETYGAKYFQNNVSDATAYEEATAIAAQIPTKNRKTCFIIGGVPFDMAKTTRVGKERYTTLNAPGTYKIEGGKMKSGVNIYKAFADETGCKTFVFDWDANFSIGFLLSLTK
jgi:hypothetical protein